MKKATVKEERNYLLDYMKIKMKIEKVGKIGFIVVFILAIILGLNMNILKTPHYALTEEETAILEEIYLIAEENPEIVNRIQINYYNYPVKVIIQDGEIIKLANDVIAIHLNTFFHFLLYGILAGLIWSIFYIILENIILFFVRHHYKIN